MYKYFLKRLTEWGNTLPPKWAASSSDSPYINMHSEKTLAFHMPPFSLLVSTSVLFFKLELLWHPTIQTYIIWATQFSELGIGVSDVWLRQTDKQERKWQSERERREGWKREGGRKGKKNEDSETSRRKSMKRRGDDEISLIVQAWGPDFKPQSLYKKYVWWCTLIKWKQV